MSSEDALGLGLLLLKGDRLAVSKAISMMENEDEGYVRLLKKIYPHTGKAFIIGITGPPGTGKSTLVNQLVRSYRNSKLRVAVLAVDPSSPLTGGALLGDRVRMLGHALDKDVFIRSMGSRGDQGGLSKNTQNAIRVLDAAGSDIIIVETVGIGQAEAEIVGVADIVVVVLMPELGDEVQAMKAGLMEIGHIFCVNKCDLPGADSVLYNIESVASSKEGWMQRAIKVSAKTGEGLDELVTTLDEFRKRVNANPEGRKSKLSQEVMEDVVAVVSKQLKERISKDANFQALLDRAWKKEIDPATAAEVLLQKYKLA